MSTAAGTQPVLRNIQILKTDMQALRSESAAPREAVWHNEVPEWEIHQINHQEGWNATIKCLETISISKRSFMVSYGYTLFIIMDYSDDEDDVAWTQIPGP